MTMTTEACPPLVSGGVELDPAHVGWLNESTADLYDLPTLRARMDRDGYLFIRGLLNRDDVLAARRVIVERLAAAGKLKPGTEIMDAVVDPAAEHSNFQPGLAKENAPLMNVLYSGAMISFFQNYLDSPVKHFDFTWLRSVGPGVGTAAHVDSVYMNRGTQNLFTVWTPLGDIDTTLGGLLVLEGTHKNTRLRETYGAQDVDAFCSNKPDAKSWGKSWGTGGALKGNPNTIRKAVGGPDARWLTANFRAGDALLFTIYTVHASLDNRSGNRIRFSSDTRYQRADEPVDERWVGPDPVGHGAAGKRGKIC